MRLYEDLHGYGDIYKRIYPIFQKPVNTFIEKIPKEGIEQIILFGSIITKYTGQDSDVDIAIISENYDLNNTKGLWRINDFDIDILIITPKEYQDNKDKINTVYWDINKKGMIMYDRRG